MSSFTIPTNDSHFGPSASNNEPIQTNMLEVLNPFVISASPARKKRGTMNYRRIVHRCGNINIIAPHDF